MKNSFFAAKIIGTLLFFGLFAQNATAQNNNSLGTDEFPRSNISAGVGTNVFMLFRNVDKYVERADTLDFLSVKSYAGPTFHFNYDYALTSVFSLGISVGRNKLGMDFKNLEFTTRDSSLVLTGNVGARLARTSFTLRPMFHYGRSAKLDMYSGARIGLAWWGLKITGEGAAEAREQFKKSLDGSYGLGGTFGPNLGATLFGIVYYPIENLGIGAELNIGQPYGLAASVNYRF